MRKCTPSLMEVCVGVSIYDYICDMERPADSTVVCTFSTLAADACIVQVWTMAVFA